MKHSRISAMVTSVLSVLMLMRSDGAVTKVGQYETGGIDVQTDTTLSGEVVLDKDGAFHKTGPGKLVVPLSQVNQTVGGWTLLNLGGTLQLNAGTDATAQTVPSVIREKAALWFTPESTVTTNGTDGVAYVKRWVDVRDMETPEARTYVSAVPAWGSNAPEDNVDKPPVKTTKDGTNTVYFGGCHSGKFMKFSADVKGIRQNFVVHGRYDCWNAVLGYGTKRAGGMVPSLSDGSPSAPTAHFCNRMDLTPTYTTGHFRLNGEPVDPFTEPPLPGFQLLACGFPVSEDWNNRLFRSNAETLAEGDTDKSAYVQGGDYVSEVILFTNVLTEAERLDVERYLMRKWHLTIAQPANGISRRLPPNGILGTATNTVTILSAAEGKSLPPLSLEGEGTVRKTGAGEMEFAPSSLTPFYGTFDWQAGTLFSRGGAFPAVKASSGDCFTSAVYTPFTPNTSRPVGCDAEAGVRLSRAATAGVGCVTKTGNDWMRINEVASDVRRLNVTGGTLVLASKTTPSAPGFDFGAPSEVIVTNADFELPFVVTTTYGRGAVSKNPGNGWRDVTGFSTAYYLAWTNSDARVWFGDGASASRVPAEHGNHVLRLNGDEASETDVELPLEGDYEISLRAKSRYGHGTSSVNYICVGSLWIGASDAEVRQVGQIFVSGLGFARYRFVLPRMAAGKYVLQLRSERTGYDGTLLVDDVSVRALGRRRLRPALPVPNGDFESVDRRATSPKLIGLQTLENVPTGWTLDVSSSDLPDAVTNSAVHLVSPAFGPSISTRISYYGLWEMLPGTAHLAFFKSGGKASRAFAVPPGRYWLKADMARETANMTPSGGYTEKQGTAVPTFGAQIAYGDSSVCDLGSVEVTSVLPAARVWPVPFEITESQTITLTVDQKTGNGFGWIDNLVLMSDTERAEQDNLLENPGAESATDLSTGGWRTSADQSYYVHSSAGVRTYESNAHNHGDNVFEGKRYFNFQSAGTMYQRVRFADAGIYRLTCHARTRSDGTSYADNNLRVWCVKDGTTQTNFTDTLLMHYSASWQERSWLIHVTSAGDYTVGFTGMGVLADGPSGDNQSHLDGLALTRVCGTVASVPEAPKTLRVSVAEGSRLVLDFPGRLQVQALKLGGNRQQGIVSAATHPDYIGGVGELEIVPAGTMLMLR